MCYRSRKNISYLLYYHSGSLAWIIPSWPHTPCLEGATSGGQEASPAWGPSSKQQTDWFPLWHQMSGSTRLFWTKKPWLQNHPNQHNRWGTSELSFYVSVIRITKTNRNHQALWETQKWPWGWVIHINDREPWGLWLCSCLDCSLMGSLSIKSRCPLSPSPKTVLCLWSRLWRDHIPRYLPGLWWRNAFHNHTQRCWCHPKGSWGWRTLTILGQLGRKSWKACRLELVHQRGCEDILNGEELQGSDPCSNREVNSS